jgi:osmotically-inducible protein OsmY
VEPAYVIQLVREAFAREEAELGVRVDILQRAVVLCGVVPSEARRARLEALARAVCGAYEVVNEIGVRPPLAADAPETLP